MNMKSVTKKLLVTGMALTGVLSLGSQSAYAGYKMFAPIKITPGAAGTVTFSGAMGSVHNLPLATAGQISYYWVPNIQFGWPNGINVPGPTAEGIQFEVTDSKGVRASCGIGYKDTNLLKVARSISDNSFLTVTYNSVTGACTSLTVSNGSHIEVGHTWVNTPSGIPDQGGGSAIPGFTLSSQNTRAGIIMANIRNSPNNNDYAYCYLTSNGNTPTAGCVATSPQVGQFSCTASDSGRVAILSTVTSNSTIQITVANGYCDDIQVSKRTGMVLAN
jgi:hypothetical protein